MSKLNELIKQFCPDGVEYKTLGEIITSKILGLGTPSKFQNMPMVQQIIMYRLENWNIVFDDKTKK
jgi:hypothetical protein